MLDRIYLTRLSIVLYIRQMLSVPSVEALSEMISSKSLNVCDSIESMEFLRNFSPL